MWPKTILIMSLLGLHNVLDTKNNQFRYFSNLYQPYPSECNLKLQWQAVLGKDVIVIHPAPYQLAGKIYISSIVNRNLVGFLQVFNF